MEEKTVTTLALSFVTEQGKSARYSLREPKDGLSRADVDAGVNALLAADVFAIGEDRFRALKDAAVVQRSVRKLTTPDAH